MPAATAKQSVDHRAAFTGLRMPNEHPIAFSECAGPNQIFQEIGVNIQNSIVHETVQCIPTFQGVCEPPVYVQALELAFI